MSRYDEDETIYTAVVNAEEQYSIWPVDRPVPDGWSAVGEPGNKSSVMDWIKEHWIDMRPLSLRRAMDAAGGS